MDVRVRRARPQDPAHGLLYESAAPYYDAYAGSEAAARRLLARIWTKPEHTASFAVSWVAERRGEMVGVLAGFPLGDGDRLAGRFLLLSVTRLPPWRWPPLLRNVRASANLTPAPPGRWWYVDALAVAPAARRTGVARALLAQADECARATEAVGVALDTGVENRPARALYESAGFVAGEVRRVRDPSLGRVVGGHAFVSYVKRLDGGPPPARP